MFGSEADERFGEGTGVEEICRYSLKAEAPHQSSLKPP